MKKYAYMKRGPPSWLLGSKIFDCIILPALSHARSPMSPCSQRMCFSFSGNSWIPMITNYICMYVCTYIYVIYIYIIYIIHIYIRAYHMPKLHRSNFFHFRYLRMGLKTPPVNFFENPFMLTTCSNCIFEKVKKYILWQKYVSDHKNSCIDL